MRYVAPSALRSAVIAGLMYAVAIDAADAGKCWTPQTGYVCMDEGPSAPAADPYAKQLFPATHSAADGETAFQAGLRSAAAGHWKDADDYFTKAHRSYGDLSYEDRLPGGNAKQLIRKGHIAECMGFVSTSMKILEADTRAEMVQFVKDAIVDDLEVCSDVKNDPQMLSFLKLTSSAIERANSVGVVNSIIDDRSRNNAGRNDTGVAAPPIRPVDVAPPTRTAPSQTSTGNPTAAERSSPSGATPPEEKRQASTNRNCGVSDVYPNLGGCVVKKWHNAIDDFNRKMDIDVFPTDSGSNDPFSK